MEAFIAGWFSHARNPQDAPLLPEDAWHAYIGDISTPPAVACRASAGAREECERMSDALPHIECPCGRAPGVSTPPGTPS